MSIICAICQKKQSGWIQDFPLSDEYIELRICNTCFQQMKDLEESKQQKYVDESKEYFENMLHSKSICDEARKVITEVIRAREQKETKKIEDAKKQEREKAEALKHEQKLEQERHERIEKDRIYNEDRVRKEREKEFTIRLERLKEIGADGYYEYKVISLLDVSGLFNKDSGKVNTIAMTEVLNRLGIDGWHLVTAYSNELGKNALSGGMGGVVLGINSTVDENILIFERFVKI